MPHVWKHTCASRGFGFAVVRAVPEGSSVELLHSTCRSSPCGHFAKIDLTTWCLVQATEAWINCKLVGKTVGKITLAKTRDYAALQLYF